MTPPISPGWPVKPAGCSRSISSRRRSTAPMPCSGNAASTGLRRSTSTAMWIWSGTRSRALCGVSPSTLDGFPPGITASSPMRKRASPRLKRACGCWPPTGWWAFASTTAGTADSKSGTPCSAICPPWTANPVPSCCTTLSTAPTIRLCLPQSWKESEQVLTGSAKTATVPG